MTLAPLNHMSNDQWREAMGLPPAGSDAPAEKPKKKNKMNAVKTRYVSAMNGSRVYDSKAEARRAIQLDQLVLAGDIVAWWPQWPAECGFNNDRGDPVMLRIDFRILWKDGRVTYEDVKGMAPTDAWNTRRKAAEQNNGIKIEIVSNRKKST